MSNLAANITEDSDGYVIVSDFEPPSQLVNVDQWGVFKTHHGDHYFVASDFLSAQHRWPRRMSSRSLTTSPRDIATAIEAVRAEPTLDGVCFAIQPTDPWMVITLSDCRDPRTGQLGDVVLGNGDPMSAQGIVDYLDSYAEATPDGTGVRCVVTATPVAEYPLKRCGGFQWAVGWTVVPVTGQRLPDARDGIQSRQSDVLDVFGAIWPAGRESPVDDDNWRQRTDLRTGHSHFDDDQQLLWKARNAKTGRRFRELFDRAPRRGSDWSRLTVELCGMLVFWTNGDVAQIDRLFRQSKLMRAKWDEPRYRNSTWGQLKITEALKRTRNRHLPPTVYDDWQASREEALQ